MLQTIENPFRNNVLKYYQSFNKNVVIRTKEEIVSCSFLYNEDIKVGNKVITNKVFIDKNVFYIKQLMDGYRFLTHSEFIQKYNARMNFLDFFSVTSAVKRYISKKILPNAKNKLFLTNQL